MRGFVAPMTLFGALVLAAPAPARAADGCTVLLCLAGNWRAINQCIPPVRDMLRDMLRGRVFPTCGFASAPSGGGSSAGASNRYITDLSQCPGPWQTPVYDNDRAIVGYTCTLTGVIDVNIDGQLWSRTYWDTTGDAITEYTPTARARLSQSQYDPTFDEAVAAWQQTDAFRVWNCFTNRVCPDAPIDGPTGGGN
jgi:hypothetical protein